MFTLLDRLYLCCTKRRFALGMSTFCSLALSATISVAAGAQTTTSSVYVTTNNNFVMDGDSITYGYNLSSPATQSWPAQAAGLPAFSGSGTITNTAVPGRTCEQVQSAYGTSVHPISPVVNGRAGYYFILCGTNNVLTGETAANTYTALRSVWSEAKSDGFRIVAFTLPYAGVDQSRVLVTQAINDMIRSAAPGSYDYLVDLQNVLPDPENPAYFQPDATHPTVGGQTLIARAANDALSTFGSVRLGEAVNQWQSFGTGVYNHRLSMDSLYSLTTGSYNIAGGGSLHNVSSGSFNVAMGQGVGNGITTGSLNTCVGQATCVSLVADALNTAVGAGADFSFDSFHSTALGAGAKASANNQLMLGTSSDTTFIPGGQANSLPLDLQVGASLPSGSVITPIAPISHVTGTSAISSITVPIRGDGGVWTGCIVLIADSGWSTTPAGNIQTVLNATAGAMYDACYDGTKWYLK